MRIILWVKCMLFIRMNGYICVPVVHFAAVEALCVNVLSLDDKMNVHLL